jgi:hypothetical protein
MSLIHKLIARTWAHTARVNPPFSSRRWMHENAWRSTDARWHICFGLRPHNFEHDDLRDDYEWWLL